MYNAGLDEAQAGIKIARMGRKVGGGVQVWEHVYTRGGFMLMYGKTNTIL